MPISDAKRKANKKWNDANMALLYDRISVLVPKGRKEDIAAFAKSRGLSVNALINEALCHTMGREESEWKSPGDTAPEAVPVEASDIPQKKPAADVETPSAVEAAEDAKEQ